MQKVIKIGTMVLAVFGLVVVIAAVIRGRKTQTGVADSIKSVVSFSA